MRKSFRFAIHGIVMAALTVGVVTHSSAQPPAGGNAKGGFGGFGGGKGAPGGFGGGKGTPGGGGIGGFGGGPAAPPPKPAIPDAKTVRTCDSLAKVELPNTTIESATEQNGACQIVASTTHPPANDKVQIWVAIPLTNWNGRFEGTGGGGFSGGSQGGVSAPLQQGYAAGATDTGHAGGSGSFAMAKDGKVDMQAIQDNAYVGIHDMTVTGKALTQALYGVAPKYAYFNGCSTGGRQGMMEAQRYPDDYNGIMAGAPAINWPKLIMQSIWSTAVMNDAKHVVPACKLQAATAAAVEACDLIDGVKDGVIEDPTRCKFDPKMLVGKDAGTCGKITEEDAAVIQRIQEGPKLNGKLVWHGQAWGADMGALATSRGDSPAAFTFTIDWIRYWLLQNPMYDANAITVKEFETFWNQSLDKYDDVIGTDNPDLSKFRDHGGKLVVWHGYADQLITASGTVDYYNRVLKAMGGTAKVEQFMRLFLAPGIGHCGGGAGANPSGQMEALLSWVEDGKAPETLPASKPGTPARTRILCPYPMVPKYKGSGSTDEAASFSCSAGF